MPLETRAERLNTLPAQRLVPRTVAPLYKPREGAAQRLDVRALHPALRFVKVSASLPANMGLWLL